MKTQVLTQQAVKGIESPSYSVDDISPNSSVVAGVTLTGDWQDVKAVLRTAILLAKNMRTPLFFGLPGEEVLAVELGGAPNATLVSELVDSATTQGPRHRGVASCFAMEVNVVAASFVCAGSITMRVRTANSTSSSRVR